MKRNELGLDRVIRVVVGLVLIGLFAGQVVTGGLGWVVLFIGAALLGTGIIGFCPLCCPWSQHQ